MTVTIPQTRLLQRAMMDNAVMKDRTIASYSAGPAMARVATMPMTGEEAINQLLANLQHDNQDIGPELLEDARTALLYSPRQKRDALLVRMIQEDSFWLKMSSVDQERMVACLESGQVRVMDWILGNEGNPQIVQSHLVALAEAAASGNEGFIDFVLQPGTGLECLSARKINLCRQIFEKWPRKSALEIVRTPHALHAMSEKELLLALRFNTLNKEMIAFATANPALVGNWPRTKVRRIRDAFELDIPALTVYIKGNIQAWSLMKDDQMVQTIRAFRIGNEAHLRQIIADRPGKQWHLSAASAMQMINNSMEKDFGIGRFLARRAWAKSSR